MRLFPCRLKRKHSTKLNTGERSRIGFDYLKICEKKFLGKFSYLLSFPFLSRYLGTAVVEYHSCLKQDASLGCCMILYIRFDSRIYRLALTLFMSRFEILMRTMKAVVVATDRGATKSGFAAVISLRMMQTEQAA